MGSKKQKKEFRRAEVISQLSGLDTLMEKTRDLIFDAEDVAKPDVSTMPKATAIVASGYEVLPGIYHSEFVDGLSDLLEDYPYQVILNVLDREGEGPWRDWMAAIDQKQLDYLRTESHAFEEVIRDLFDGFLSLEERIGIKPPDKQTVAPLVIWGSPDIGPYTWPAHWYDVGIRMSIVSLPPAYRHNVALWAALGHECAGHDILTADNGLLGELEEKVRLALLEADLEGEVEHEGRMIAMNEFASVYWSDRINETASDICGLLNLGPAAAIGLVVLFVPFGNGNLSRWTSVNDSHPIDLTRNWLASDLIAGLKYMDKVRADAWVDTIENMEAKYSEEGDLELRERSLYGGWQTRTIIPRNEFRKTAKIVAETIAFEKMAALEHRSLADINTWTTMDEALADSVAQDLLDGRDVEIHQTAEATTYAAHVLSGGVLAMCEENANIEEIHTGTIKALAGLYDINPVWGGFPFHLPRDPVAHYMFSVERKMLLKA